jgi:hypothetical protein
MTLIIVPPYFIRRQAEILGGRSTGSMKHTHIYIVGKEMAIKLTELKNLDLKLDNY